MRIRSRAQKVVLTTGTHTRRSAPQEAEDARRRARARQRAYRALAALHADEFKELLADEMRAEGFSK